ncbi:MAG: hypothetical protein GY757_53950, partial [bacterium]|nr:hypothetical protein [bacterium]
SHGFAGNNRILGIDFSAHYDFDRHRYLLLQAEFLTRKLDGTRYARHVHGDDEDDTEPLQRGFFRTFETDEHNHGDTGIPEVEQVPQTMTQSGFYAQLIYRFHRLWQIGARWDNLDKNSIRVDGLLQPLPGALNRYGFMMGFKLDSFLKLRLEYNINRFGYLDGMLKNYHELALHAVITIGKHGNHGTHGNSDAHGTHCAH